MEKENYLIGSLMAVLGLLVIGLLSNQGFLEGNGLTSVTGGDTTANAETSAVISSYFAINMSTNMSTSGIQFDIQALPVTNINTTANYNNASGGNNETKYYLTVDIDSNVNVDFCIKANDSLRSGANFIGLGNYTWSNSTNNNISFPAFGSAKALINSSYDNSTSNIAAGSSSYYRFWLSVPASQSAGTYVNKINFKGVQTGNGC